MGIEVEDTLKVGFVIVDVELLDTPEQVDVFRAAVGAEVMPGVVGIVIDPAGVQQSVRRLIIDRDRIILDLSTDRAAIERHYPTDDDFQHLADVFGHAVRITDIGIQPRSFGYHVELVVDQDSGKSARQYLASSVLAPDLPSLSGSEVSGGAMRLLFGGTPAEWNVTLEPRLDDETSKIYCTFTLRHEEARLPDAGEIAASLRETKDEAIRFLEALDQREGRRQ